VETQRRGHIVRACSGLFFFGLFVVDSISVDSNYKLSSLCESLANPK